MYRARHGRSMVATDNALFPYDAESLAEQVQQLRRVRNEQVGGARVCRRPVVFELIAGLLVVFEYC